MWQCSPSLDLLAMLCPMQLGHCWPPLLQGRSAGLAAQLWGPSLPFTAVSVAGELPGAEVEQVSRQCFLAGGCDLSNLNTSVLEEGS